MFEPVRGGTRGGQAEFKWSDVSADKDRENYLGHSINAPTGRWQKNKDIHWYNRDVGQSAEERAEEIRKIKDMEADALAVALGFEPSSKSQGATTVNTAPVASSSNSNSKVEQLDGQQREDKDKKERLRKKEERKQEKRAMKELKKLGKSGASGFTDSKDVPRRNHSRSRSPRFRSRERRLGERRPRSRSRSRTPAGDQRSGASSRYAIGSDYNSFERERERESDRRRWDLNNARRNPPQNGRRF